MQVKKRLKRVPLPSKPHPPACYRLNVCLYVTNSVEPKRATNLNTNTHTQLTCNMLCATHTPDLLKSCCTKEKTHNNTPTIYPIYKEYVRYIKYCTLSFRSTYIICLYCYLLLFYIFGIYRTTLIKKEKTFYINFYFRARFCVDCLMFIVVSLSMFWFLHTFIIVICWLHCTYTTPHTRIHFAPLFPPLSQSVVTHALVVPATHTVCSLSLSPSLL